MLLISALIFVITFLSITLGFVSSLFFFSFECKVKLFDFSGFLRYRYLFLTVPLLELFLLHPMNFDVLHIHFIYIYVFLKISLLIHSLTHGLFNRMLFNQHIFLNFLKFFI